MNDRPHELALQAAYFALLAVGRGSLARAAFQKQRAAEEQTKHLRRRLSRRVVPTTFALEQYAKTLNEHLAKVETIPATLTVRQVAEALGVSRARVSQLLKAGVIPGVKLGPHAKAAWRIPTREFLAMFVLANAPTFVRDMNDADAELAAGETSTLDEALDEIERDQERE